MRLIPILRLAAALALPLGLVPAPLHPQAAAEAPGAARYARAIEAGRAAVAKLMRDQAIPGMSVAVLVDGRVVWSEGFGYADVENRTAVTPLTRFRIASISKPVTAAALGRLLEEGRLDLDAPIQRYVPYFPAKRWPISTRQVAGHLAGIRHYRGEENLSSRRYGTVREGLSIFQDDSLEFEPGTRYLYSSYGWNLLSAVVEGASGKAFLPFMREAVFEPLGLRSIVAEHTDSVIPFRAEFYVRGPDGRILNAPYVDNSYKWAGGGFLSNAEDLVRFGWAHLDGGLLRPATVEVLFAPQRTRAGEDTGYGIGWSTVRDGRQRRWVGHTGGAVGGRSVLMLQPDAGVVVAALANLGSAPMTPQLAAELGGPFLAARGGAAR